MLDLEEAKKIISDYEKIKKDAFTALKKIESFLEENCIKASHVFVETGLGFDLLVKGYRVMCRESGEVENGWTCTIEDAEEHEFINAQFFFDDLIRALVKTLESQKIACELLLKYGEN